MKGVFMVFDRAVGEHVGPVLWLMASPVVAVRQFQEIAANPESSVSKYPEDHVLYHIGILDGLSLTLFPEPQRLGSALELRKPEAPTNG